MSPPWIFLLPKKKSCITYGKTSILNYQFTQVFKSLKQGGHYFKKLVVVFKVKYWECWDMFLSISQHCCLEIGIGIEICTEIIIVMRKLLLIDGNERERE